MNKYFVLHIGASVSDIVGGSGSRSSKACNPEYEENRVTVFNEGMYNLVF